MLQVENLEHWGGGVEDDVKGNRSSGRGSQEKLDLLTAKIEG